MSVGTDEQIRAALTECQRLANDEYGQSLDAIWKDKEELIVSGYGGSKVSISLPAARFGRLAGVSLKRNFAKQKKISKESRTGANWQWDFDFTKFGEQKAENTIEYQVVLELYKARDRKADTFETYVNANLYEGSWFRDLAHAVHPVLCKREQSILLETVSEVLKKGFEDGLFDVVKRIQEALGGTSLEKLPWVIAIFLAGFIMKVGMKAFCSYAEDSGKLVRIFDETDFANS